jgi:hypothetical protein
MNEEVALAQILSICFRRSRRYSLKNPFHLASPSGGERHFELDAPFSAGSGNGACSLTV